jgi:transglutaminase-like putative cysteine protease
MDFTIGCTLSYGVDTLTPFVFNLEAARSARQQIRSEWLRTAPELGEPDRFEVAESGNRIIRFLVPPGPFKIEYEAEVSLDPLIVDPITVTEMAAGSLALEVLPYLNASRYCQSDRLNRFANRQFGNEPAGHQRVTAICNWIRDHVDYQAGTSDALTSAYDTFGDRTGVCRDFAHLAIALCRAVGIPARYISAYAWQLSPPDFHAVFEAYLGGPDGGAWFLFDPTRMAVLDGLVRIGAGRDAADVAFCSIYGNATTEAPSVWIKGPEPQVERTTQAVSTQASA